MAFAGRDAAGMLRAVGLPELITYSLDDYERLARKLATEPDTLRPLRAKLDENRRNSGLFDLDRYRRHIEIAYVTMWERRRRGKGPEWRFAARVAQIYRLEPAAVAVLRSYTGYTCRVGVDGNAEANIMLRQIARSILVMAAVAAVILLDTHASQAYEGQWCAVTNRGGGTVSWNCSMRSFDMCVQEVIAGNRGFCNPNPRWQGNWSSEGRSYRKRYAY
jgi:hypothetical protein